MNSADLDKMTQKPSNTRVQDELSAARDVLNRATSDMPAYIAKLWLEAGKRRREAGRLETSILETLGEAERIEALARQLEEEQAQKLQSQNPAGSA